MKKYITYFSSLLVSLVIVLSYSSCSNNNDYYNMSRALATVTLNADGYAESFTLDSGEKLFVKESTSSHKPKSERMLFNFTVLDEAVTGYDYAIRLNGYYDDVLTKNIKYIATNNVVEQDTIGYDQIKVNWIRAQGEYLSLEFQYDASSSSIAHLISMVSASSDFEIGADIVNLEFRHNAHGDAKNYLTTPLYVCFRIHDYIAKAKELDKDEITFKITWQNLLGNSETEEMVYRLKEIPVPSPIP